MWGGEALVGNCFALKRRHSRRYLIVCSAMVIAISVCTAWADPSPREFYGKDFASAPYVSNAPLQGEDVLKSSQAKQAADSEENSASGAVGAEEQGGADNVDAQAIAAMQAQGGLQQRKKRDSVPATTLMLFVSSIDKHHVRSVLKKAIEVAKKDEAFLTTVFHIGDYRNIPDDLAATLDLYGVAVAPMPAPPEELALTQSPAWVFQNKDGVQIVEGAVDVEQFYDSEGNFKEPEKFIAQQASTEPSELEK